MKKLGVIVCGQPRFIKYTWKFIKEQYTIPGYETKYFGHLWNGVGYSKNNDINDEYEPHEISDNIAKDFTADSNNFHSMNASTILDMDANDTITVRVSITGGGSVIDLGGTAPASEFYTSWSGVLIC